MTVHDLLWYSFKNNRKGGNHILDKWDHRITKSVLDVNKYLEDKGLEYSWAGILTVAGFARRSQIKISEVPQNFYHKVVHPTLIELCHKWSMNMLFNAHKHPDDRCLVVIVHITWDPKDVDVKVIK